MAKSAKRHTKRARQTKPAKSAKQQLVITLSGERPIREVAADLATAGFEVDQVLDVIGSVTGSSHAKNLGRLRKVRGVSDVSPDYPVDIGPPGAPVS